MTTTSTETPARVPTVRTWVDYRHDVPVTYTVVDGDGAQVFIAPANALIYEHKSPVGEEYDFRITLDADREVSIGDFACSRADFRALLVACLAVLDETEVPK